jgi:hypothetical protein
MIVNGSKKAWFYPSKGLNELFYRAGKVAMSNTKVATSKSPNPIPKPLKATPVNSQRRRSYVEVLKMAQMEAECWEGRRWRPRSWSGGQGKEHHGHWWKL